MMRLITQIKMLRDSIFDWKILTVCNQNCSKTNNWSCFVACIFDHHLSSVVIGDN